MEYGTPDTYKHRGGEGAGGVTRVMTAMMKAKERCQRSTVMAVMRGAGRRRGGNVGGVVEWERGGSSDFRDGSSGGDYTKRRKE